jgi:hypothetical protein
MAYLLSPFTNFVLQLLGLGPFWVLYLGTVLSLLGVILTLSDKTGVLGAALALAKSASGIPGRTTVKISPGVALRVGVSVLLIGLAIAAAGTDAIAASPTTFITYGAGGPSFFPCLPPLDWLPCYAPAGQNSTNVCTSSNVGTSSCDPHGAFSFTIGLAAKTTTSTTLVSTGYGLSLKTVTIGKLNGILTGLYKTNTLTDGVGFGVYKNTVGIPANGVGVGSDTGISTQIISNVNDTYAHNFALIVFDQSATVGTTFFYYIVFEAVTGGTATLSSLRITLTETPS